ncbi:MAG: hypothetical protein RBR69_04685 [Candidatus Cloacimonadaceae bacterium]|jgi:hypothetical protein|nr:hypothetical protein [Candidatus Cloacimonadota bacterium]MDY0127404.1 hypothetical protein [Candidatus Cloacimonadaceae bacterium]MCB5255735.1 hypothetical protein [Candidatus Cloacimonadota bacterium]MCK9177854.1 hypothetical protein [Candidatus Cloacimonadota bacterium]MCK9242056.1 hypothetical protein [Candidatus Cloacimonadota bacterium]
MTPLIDPAFFVKRLFRLFSFLCDYRENAIRRKFGYLEIPTLIMSVKTIDTSASNPNALEWKQLDSSR